MGKPPKNRPTKARFDNKTHPFGAEKAMFHMAKSYLLRSPAYQKIVGREENGEARSAQGGAMAESILVCHPGTARLHQEEGSGGIHKQKISQTETLQNHVGRKELVRFPGGFCDDSEA